MAPPPPSPSPRGRPPPPPPPPSPSRSPSPPPRTVSSSAGGSPDDDLHNSNPANPDPNNHPYPHASERKGRRRRGRGKSPFLLKRRTVIDVAVFVSALCAFLFSVVRLHRRASSSSSGSSTGRDAAASVGGLDVVEEEEEEERQQRHADLPVENRRHRHRHRHRQNNNNNNASRAAVAAGVLTKIGRAGKTHRLSPRSPPSSSLPKAGSTDQVSDQGSIVAKDPAKEKKKPMNVLLLYADDWRHDTLGAAGNPVVKTPTLDRLASEGVRFTDNCVTTSVCWCSRVTLYTGLYTARHNTTKPRYFFANWTETIYAQLRDEGYHVGHVGKWGVNHYNKKTIPFSVEDDGWHVRQSGPKTWHITEKNEADALRFFETRPRDKPFFVNVAFFATHAVDGDKRQYLPQNSSLSMYSNAHIPNPATNTLESFKRLPYFFTDRNEGRTRWRWRYDTEEKRQHMMKNYYRMATEVDTACGVILKELERQGELDNTMIIFTTDNGNFHAEHGLADKWYPHQESIRVPLIIKDPRMDPSKIGTLNDDFTLNVDLAPTILRAAGVEPPAGMMGRDMSVLYRTEEDGGLPRARDAEGASSGGTSAGAAPPGGAAVPRPSESIASFRRLHETSRWRTEFFYEHPVIIFKHYIPSSEALVRKDYKYFYWPDFGVEQLFHVSEDPMEEGDLLGMNSSGFYEVSAAKAKAKATNAKATNATAAADVGRHVRALEEMRTRFRELKGIIQDTRDPVIV